MRWLTRDDARDERGAVAVMVALLLIALLGMAAYVVDVGAIYQERRELQNGADAAALAVAADCARGNCGAYGVTAKTFADANADDDTSQVDGVTIDMTARTAKVDTSTIDTEGGSEVPFRFAPVLGESGHHGNASATAQWGPTILAVSLPLVLSQCEWDREVGSPDNLPSGQVTLTFHDGDNAEPCNGPAGQDVPGGFGWLDAAGCTASPAVDEDGVWVGSNPGVSPPKGCSPSDFPLGEPLLFPLFSDAEGQGQFARFNVVGYVAFEPTGYRLAPGNTWNAGTATCTTPTTTTTTAPAGNGNNGGSGSPSDQVCITGRFVEYYEADGQLGGPKVPNFGVQTAELIK